MARFAECRYGARSYHAAGFLLDLRSCATARSYFAVLKVRKVLGHFGLDLRKIATQHPTGINLTNTLDGAGNRLVLQDSYGTTSYTWDMQSRLTKIQNPLNEVTSIRWDFSRSRAASHPRKRNGCGQPRLRRSLGRETLLQNISAAGVGQAIFINAYSPTNNRLTVSEIDGTLVTYGYDAHSQLTSEARSGTYAYNTSYVYDPNGNRLQKYDSGALTQYSLNSANELTLVTPSSGAPTTNSYDVVGNLTGANTGGALTTQIWSPENRLLSYADSAGNNEQYLYSDDGLRKKRVSGATTTRFTYDETALLLENRCKL